MSGSPSSGWDGAHFLAGGRFTSSSDADESLGRLRTRLGDLEHFGPGLYLTPLVAGALSGSVGSEGPGSGFELLPEVGSVAVPLTFESGDFCEFTSGVASGGGVPPSISLSISSVAASSSSSSSSSESSTLTFSSSLTSTASSLRISCSTANLSRSYQTMAIVISHILLAAFKRKTNLVQTFVANGLVLFQLLLQDRIGGSGISAVVIFTIHRIRQMAAERRLKLFQPAFLQLHPDPFKSLSR